VLVSCFVIFVVLMIVWDVSGVVVVKWWSGVAVITWWGGGAGFGVVLGLGCCMCRGAVVCLIDVSCCCS